MILLVLYFAQEPQSRSSSKKKYQELEPLGKKNQEPLEKKSGAGATKRLAGSPVLVKIILFLLQVNGN